MTHNYKGYTRRGYQVSNYDNIGGDKDLIRTKQDYLIDSHRVSPQVSTIE
jgi:hypothetical protein